MTLTTKITVLFLALSVIPLAIIGVLAYYDGRQALQQDTIDRLYMVTTLKESEFNRWLEGNERHLRALAQRPLVVEYTETLTESDVAAADYSEAYDLLQRNHLQPALLDKGGWKRLFVLDPDTGEILASSDPEMEGLFRENEAFFIEGRTGTTTTNPDYSLSLEEMVMATSTPVTDENGNLIAVLAGHLDLEEMDDIISQKTEMSQTQETYLVNNFNFLLTETRLEPTSIVGKAIHSKGVEDCLAKNDGWGLYEDYRDVPVLGVYSWMPEHELCIITEVDEQEALAPTMDLRNTIFGIGLAVMLATGALGIVFTQSLTRPIRWLAQSAEQLGKGNLAHRVDVDRTDELGTLADAFNSMAEDLFRSQAELHRANEELEQRVEERTAELEASEERFRKVFEAVPVPLLITRVSDGLMLEANERFAPSMALPPDKVIGQKSPNLYADPADRDALTRTLSEQGSFYDRELRIRRADGSEGSILLSMQQIEFDGQPAIVSGFQDITARKEAQEAVRRSEERFKALVQNAVDAVTILDSEGTIIYDSPPIEDIIGFTPEERKGTNVNTYIHPDDLPELSRAFGEMFEAPGTTIGAEMRFQHKDGSWHIIEATGTNLLYDPAIEGIVSNWHDITEQRKAQQQLEEYAADLKRSNEELERFAYVASHDLQEPLRMVTSYLQLIEHRYKDELDEDAGEFIHYAVDGASRMKTLIQDLLTFSRVGTRGKPPEPVDSEEVVERVLSDLSESIKETGAQITHDPLPTVHADSTQLHQLFSNLIGNAIKFRGEAPPKIHIGLERNENKWQFCVRDNGIGFEVDEYGERIFIIFQRLHTKNTYGGTGIGLAVCKKIVERHGGQIWVKSAPNEGSKFYFTLPDTKMEKQHASTTD